MTWWLTKIAYMAVYNHGKENRFFINPGSCVTTPDSNCTQRHPNINGVILRGIAR